MRVIAGLHRCGLAAILLGLSSCGEIVGQIDPKAYDKALALLAEGRQDKAENMLARAVRYDKKNQRLVFFLGVCSRSRWRKGEARSLFQYTQELNPVTPEARCAALVVAIDSGQDYTDTFKALEAVHRDHPDDPLILWLMAITCRELGKRGASRVYSVKGAQFYAKLLEFLDPGPVLLHQSYANILSEELGRHEEALKHRIIAVHLEPAAWSYQGLANTLSYLERYSEADVHYKTCTEMAPRSASYVVSWAWSLGRRGNYEQAFELYKKAADLAPNAPKSWRNLAWCAAKLNRHGESQRYTLRADALEQKKK